MKKNIFKPFAIMAVSAITLFGCAGSSENANTAETGEITTDPVVVTDNQELSNVTEENSDEFFANIDNTENYDVLSLVKMDNNLSTFAELIEQSGLNTSFGQAGGALESVTIFAPTNEALENMSQSEMEQLRDPQNQAQLVQFVQRHIIPSKVPLIQFQSNQVIETSGEEQIPVDTEMNGNAVFIGGAQIVESDVEASNGMVHVVNSVVQPSEFNTIMGE